MQASSTPVGSAPEMLPMTQYSASVVSSPVDSDASLPRGGVISMFGYIGRASYARYTARGAPGDVTPWADAVAVMWAESDALTAVVMRSRPRSSAS